MGEVTQKILTKADAIAALAKLNPAMGRDKLTIYVDAMIQYREATENIEKNGAICVHPRTGAPLENPYLKVRASAAATLAKFRIRTGDLWP